MERVFGEWARRVQCDTLVIHDAYLCGVRHSSDLGPASVHMDTDELTAAVEDYGLARATGLALVDELVQVVDQESGHLTRVQLRTWGLLRADAPAGPLLDRWATSFAGRCAHRGIGVGRRR